MQLLHPSYAHGFALETRLVPWSEVTGLTVNAYYKSLSYRIPMISKATQIVVPLANRPGALADVCSALGQVGVNIIAIYAPEAKGRGKVRVMVVADDLDGARAALKRRKIRFSEEEVLDIEMDNRPGAFGELAGKLARAKINIRYAYATTSAFARAKVVMAVPDVDKALAILGK